MFIERYHQLIAFQAIYSHVRVLRWNNRPLHGKHNSSYFDGIVIRKHRKDSHRQRIVNEVFILYKRIWHSRCASDRHFFRSKRQFQIGIIYFEVKGEFKRWCIKMRETKSAWVVLILFGCDFFHCVPLIETLSVRLLYVSSWGLCQFVCR